MPVHLEPHKVVDLPDAVARVVDGSMIALGGGLFAPLPMAMVRELIRQGRGGLHVVGSAHSIDVDLLIAAGCVGVCEESYVGFEQDLGLAPAYRRAAESGGLEIRESCCDTILNQLRAAEFGIPFIPVRGVVGSDILRLHPEYAEVTCPFTEQRLVAVPPLRPDVALIHAPLGDRRGNLHLDQPYVLDERFAAASATVVATVERLPLPHSTLLAVGPTAAHRTAQKCMRPTTAPAVTNVPASGVTRHLGSILLVMHAVTIMVNRGQVPCLDSSEGQPVPPRESAVADDGGGKPLASIGIPTVRRRSEADALVKKPWVYELRWAVTHRYLGKLSHIDEGHALSLQYHVEKDEAILVLRGTLPLLLEDDAGEVRSYRLLPGMSARVLPGRKHRFVAVTDVDLIEVSSPELEDVVRLEDRYRRAGAPPVGPGGHGTNQEPASNSTTAAATRRVPGARPIGDRLMSAGAGRGNSAGTGADVR